MPIPMLVHERLAVSSWVDSLESWNLKYDEFPEVMVIGFTLLIGVYPKHTHEIEFATPENAVVAAGMLKDAMGRRADNFHGCNRY